MQCGIIISISNNKEIRPFCLFSIHPTILLTQSYFAVFKEGNERRSTREREREREIMREKADGKREKKVIE